MGEIVAQGKGLVYHASVLFIGDVILTYVKGMDMFAEPAKYEFSLLFREVFAVGPGVRLGRLA